MGCGDGFRLGAVPSIRAMYGRILVATDGSINAQRAVEHAVQRATSDGSELHAVYVMDSRPPAVGGVTPWTDWDETAQLLRKEARKHLDSALEQAQAEGLQVHKAVKQHEGVADGILDYARDHDVDLIVVGTHGRSGIDRFVMGSVAEKVTRNSALPVLVVPPKRPDA